MIVIFEQLKLKSNEGTRSREVRADGWTSLFTSTATIWNP